ncbi:MAG: tape measure protein [Rhodanobacteraceae bacterium]|nr:tape measure protein [Rhodanobacteraceae bacterium]
MLAFVGVSWATQQVTQLVQVADQWNLMVARLKLATAGQREFVIAQGELFAIAQRIGVPLAEVSTLYGKLQQAVRQLGGEQKTALSLTESISQALRISGASASEAQSSLLQFGQALASGVLRGEEFNSVVENSPRLAQALADGLNVPIGRLRKLAEQGQLTADVVVNALMSQKDKLAAEYAQLPVTVGTAFERVKNAFAQWIAKVDESTGITQKLATALDWLAPTRDGDGLAQGHRRDRPGGVDLPTDPGTDHGVATGRHGGGYGGCVHGGGMEHRQPFNVGGGGVRRLAEDVVCGAGGRTDRLGDRHLVVGEVRSGAQGRHRHGPGAGKRHGDPEILLGALCGDLHQRHHCGGHAAPRGTAAADERDLRRDVRRCVRGWAGRAASGDDGSRQRRGNGAAAGSRPPGHAGSGRSRHRSHRCHPQQAQESDHRNRAGGGPRRSKGRHRRSRDHRGLSGA